MYVIQAENVRHAYAEGLALLRAHGEASPSRVGSVLVAPMPVTTVYQRPDQRVLLDPQRDANPFFHLLESFWMLAGRQDVASIAQYNDRMRTYSDDGVKFHAAYGHRWRDHFWTSVDEKFGYREFDQLVMAIEELRRDPLSRRVVIAMWDPTTDLGGEGLDLPCNTHIYLRLRQDAEVKRLDLTVCCRSNDAIFGAHGANAVHFSVLQEFIASMLGVRMGTLTQISNNYHMYTEVADRVGVPGVPAPYGATMPLFGDLSGLDPREILAEIGCLWDDDADGETEHLPATTIALVHGMRKVWAAWKAKDAAAFIMEVHRVPHDDWRQACIEWGSRRWEKFL